MPHHNQIPAESKNARFQIQHLLTKHIHLILGGSYIFIKLNAMFYLNLSQFGVVILCVTYTRVYRCSRPWSEQSLQSGNYLELWDGIDVPLNSASDSEHSGVFGITGGLGRPVESYVHNWPYRSAKEGEISVFMHLRSRLQRHLQRKMKGYVKTYPCTIKYPFKLAVSV